MDTREGDRQNPRQFIDRDGYALMLARIQG